MGHHSKDAGRRATSVGLRWSDLQSPGESGQDLGSWTCLAGEVLEGEVLRIFQQALNEIVSEARFERSVFIQSDLVGANNDRGNQKNRLMMPQPTKRLTSSAKTSSAMTTTPRTLPVDQRK